MIAATLSTHTEGLGECVLLPDDRSDFAFTLLPDGSLPLNGDLPSVIDHMGDEGHFARIPDLGARLRSFRLEHPEPDRIAALYASLGIVDPPVVVLATRSRYRTQIDTPTGFRELT